MAIDGKGLFYYGTIVIVRLYPDGKIVYASGGHPPLYYFNSANQSIEEIQNTGPLVGIFYNIEFKDSILNMNSKDMLLLYTDGIIESMDIELRKLYGDERLKNNIMAFSGEPVMDMLHSICGSMYEFTGYAPLEDDVTLICIKKT
jgi:sigma-B regulation protein RsbU (phosphoserine phosphatase)